jgi:hypothetical protein
MDILRVFAIVMLAVLVMSCSGQPSGEADTQAAGAEAEQVFEDDFESGETEEWDTKDEPKPATADETPPTATPE